MGSNRKAAGFTVVEMIVTLVVLSLFITLFFQLYTTSETQRIAVLRRSAANDIAMSNLKKIDSIANKPATTPSCASGGGTIATSSGSPSWAAAGLNTEPTTNTLLLPDTTQTLAISYPFGCATSKPAKITSTVTYSSGSEIVTREILIN
jgi:prepilin-type N-terminal cleavage/methylation domain-containing protein